MRRRGIGCVAIRGVGAESAAPHSHDLPSLSRVGEVDERSADRILYDGLVGAVDVDAKGARYDVEGRRRAVATIGVGQSRLAGWDSGRQNADGLSGDRVVERDRVSLAS